MSVAIRAFAARLGGWPTRYVAFDVETTGLDPSLDLVVQVGYALVEAGKVIDRRSFIVDWTQSDVSQTWLAERLVRVAAAMGAKGLTHCCPYERMAAEGLPPAEVFDLVRDLFAGRLIVGHNLVAFDVPMLVRSFARAGLAPMVLSEDGVLDTAAVEACCQLAHDPRHVCGTGETVAAWCKRLLALARGNRVKTALAGCLEKRGLDRTGLHEAGGDADAVCRLVDAWRAELDGPSPTVSTTPPPRRPPLPTPQSGSPAPRRPTAGPPRYRGPRPV